MPRSQILIDRDFARFGDKSFAMRQIDSIEVKTVRPNSGSAAALFLTFGFLSLVAIPAAGPMALLLALLFGALGFAAWRKARRVEHVLLLTTSSGQVQAASSADAAEILALRDRIEEYLRA